MEELREKIVNRIIEIFKDPEKRPAGCYRIDVLLRGCDGVYDFSDEQIDRIGKAAEEALNSYLDSDEESEGIEKIIPALIYAVKKREEQRRDKCC